MIVTHKISTKAMSVNADIARIDELYPDKEVHYTYIGMGSLDEGFPLLIHFNDDIDLTTIVEPWDTFDLPMYKDRILNLNELISDIQSVKDAGVSTVRKISPSTGVDRTADTNLVEGQWAIYQGTVYVNPKYPDVHVEWFERIGLPTYGHEFDRVTRGTFALEGDVLYVARNSGAGFSEDLLDQQNRLAEKILYTIKSPLQLNDLSDYKVTAKTAATKDVGNWAIAGGKLHAQKGNLMHSLWFENIGLPHYGKAFDEIARGWYELKDGELQLVVYNEGYPEHVDTLFSNADRIADRALKLEGVPEVTDIQLYEVAGASKKRIGQKLTEGIMGKIGQELEEEEKIALLMKYAGNDYIQFDAGGTLRISLDKLDLTILPEIDKLKSSEGAVEAKIAKAKEIALAAATEKLSELLDIPGVSISFGSLELSDENMDWDDLLTPEEEG